MLVWHIMLLQNNRSLIRGRAACLNEGNFKKMEKWNVEMNIQEF
jgi:hypothetical protein